MVRRRNRASCGSGRAAAPQSSAFRCRTVVVDAALFPAHFLFAGGSRGEAGEAGRSSRELAHLPRALRSRPADVGRRAAVEIGSTLSRAIGGDMLMSDCKPPSKS